MEIILCSSSVPFVRGGAYFIVHWLERKLVEYGHKVETILLPFDEDPQNLFVQITAYRLMDLMESGDRMITFRPPSHLLRHPQKVLWFIHHLRGYYDLWNTQYRPVDDSASGRATRATLFSADRLGLSEARHVFTNSNTMGDRLRKFNEVESQTLYPPLNDPERFRCDSFGDEIVCVSRIEPHKRQHLLVQAMLHTRTPVRLHLSGTGNQGYCDKVESLIRRLDLTEKVLFERRWISEDEKVDRLASALAVAYVPFEEDSYGYTSLEGSHAQKPILTTRDSGGVTELVLDSVNGYISEPEPAALAEAMDHLWLDKSRSSAMGIKGLERVSDLGISWDNAISRLLE